MRCPHGCYQLLALFAETLPHDHGAVTDPQASPTRVAVLGLGRMGGAIAARLRDQGHCVTGWSRTRRELPGVGDAADPSAAVEGAAVVVLALFDGQACRDVVALLPEQLPAVVVNTSTVGPREAAGLEKLVTAVGARYLHAPIIGSTSAVARGAATLLVGGDPDAATAGVLAAIGTWVGCGDTTTAAGAKLVANSVLAQGLLAVGAAAGFAAALGVPRSLTWDVLERTAVGGLVTAKRDRLESGHLGAAEFTIAALAKDVALLVSRVPAARDLGRAVDQATLAVPPDADVAALCVPVDGAAEVLEHQLEIAPTVSVPPDLLEPLRDYVAGHATGDPAHHRRAFLPTAHVEGLREGRFTSWRLEEFCALFTGSPAANESRRRRRLDHVAVHGTVATATMTLRHGPDTFTDVFLLVRTDTGWRIANKAYHRATAGHDA